MAKIDVPFFLFFKLAPSDAELLLAAAAGAGFAGVYIAPLTGMFFCIEILLKKSDCKDSHCQFVDVHHCDVGRLSI